MADDTVTLSLTIPREALTVVAPPPEFVHQRNVAAVIGLPPRQYLDLCRRGVWPVAVEGKLRLARREEVVAYLASRARILERRAALAAVTPDGDENRPFTLDDLPPGFVRGRPAGDGRLRAARVRRG